MLRGELDRARWHLQAAEAVARRESLRMGLARTLEGRADLTLADGGAGSAARAHELLAEAAGSGKRWASGCRCGDCGNGCGRSLGASTRGSSSRPA